MKLIRQKTVWLPTWQGWTLLFLIAAGLLVTAFLNVHRFLAVTQRVEADVLIVEAWMPKTVTQEAVKEFTQGQYTLLVVMEMTSNGDPRPKQDSALKTPMAKYFVSHDVPTTRIIECFAPATNDRRSLTMADAVRKTLNQRGITARGFNVFAPGAHARKTWLLYRRALSSIAPVGIVSIPTGDYDPAKWWKTTNGANWVIVNGIGWFYEWIKKS